MVFVNVALTAPQDSQFVCLHRASHLISKQSAAVIGGVTPFLLKPQYDRGCGGFIVAFPPTVAQFYAASDKASDMVTHFISGALSSILKHLLGYTGSHLCQ